MLDTFKPFLGVLGVLGLAILFYEACLLFYFLVPFRDALGLVAKLFPPWTEPTMSPSLSDWVMMYC